MWYPEENEYSLSEMFNHCTMEALLMRRLKRDMWKAGIALAGTLLLLVLMMWIPVLAVGAYEGSSGLAISGTVTVQATPTVDATVAALNKEKLKQEVQQLKNQNEPDPLSWLRTNAAILLSTLVVVIGGLIGLFRWFGDRRSEREKRAEERFQSVVTGLGDEKESARIHAAILLRTFLRPGYEQFYTQTFDLAVADLRRRNVHPNTPEPLDFLSQALITVFKESFPLAREHLQKPGSHFSSHHLDATAIRLDKAYLRGCDLKQAWMPEASLREADLSRANLSRANLINANLSRAKLLDAKLNGASLFGTDLLGADLLGADLSKANIEDALYLYGTSLRGVNGLTKEQLETCKAKGAIIDENPATLVGADLTKAYLPDAHLHLADLREAVLIGAVLSGTDLSGADLTGVHLENAVDLRKTNLHGVKGLTKEQLASYKALGAIIDEDPTSSLSQSIVIPPPPLQSQDAQAPSAPSAQGSTPTPDTDGSSTASSKPSNSAQSQSAVPAQGSSPPDTDGSNAASSSQSGP